MPMYMQKGSGTTPLVGSPNEYRVRLALDMRHDAAEDVLQNMATLSGLHDACKYKYFNVKNEKPCLFVVQLLEYY